MLTTGAAVNWAGNIRYGAARVHRPGSVGELRRIVASADRVRALGTGHSFNPIADTSGDLVRLDGLPREVDIDPRAMTATVGAGMRYAEVAERLQVAGYALANLASLPHISVAGACATGTHGSGETQRGLAAAVAGLETVGPEGDLTVLTRADDPERLNGSVVGLGALGIVTSVTLDIEPAYEIAQRVYTGFPLDRLGADFDAVASAAYSVSVFTDWRGEAMVWLKRRTGGPEDGGSGGAAPEEWLGARLAAGPQHPVPGMPPAYCTDQSGTPGPWHERLPHFRPAFTPSKGAELQSELLLPRGAAAEAFAALRELGELMAPVLQVSEIRTVAGDDQWLSPAQGRDSVALHFTWSQDTPAVLSAVAAMEERLMPLGARPHWGKLTTTAPEEITARYEHAAAFRALLAESDPAGKFRNPYVDALFPPL
ncbi:FAD-binding protein [Streptomyces lycii]|uniref:FAD-binding protein n=1 Tax=Streptomyces lycii TaxID=2654337 RepID=A0ABQ7FJ75_9ACTN|nr:FAD-binding protein [Streptomyces lycii]KAF4408870.1 FAD-binding protein [Streptomyces lycii]